MLPAIEPAKSICSLDHFSVVAGQLVGIVDGGMGMFCPQFWHDAATCSISRSKPGHQNDDVATALKAEDPWCDSCKTCRTRRRTFIGTTTRRPQYNNPWAKDSSNFFSTKGVIFVSRPFAQDGQPYFVKFITGLKWGSPVVSYFSSTDTVPSLKQTKTIT